MWLERTISKPFLKPSRSREIGKQVSARILCREPTDIRDFRRRTDFVFHASRARWTYRALQSGELDLIAGNSTNGLIAALDLFQLADDRRYFPPYQAVFIARSDTKATLTTVFERLNNAIPTDDMRAMNLAVDRDGKAPREVAAQWLASKF